MLQLVMFPPALRATPQQIEEVMRFGVKKTGNVGYLRFKQADTMGLAVIVPKKVDKRSTKRNLIKRRVRTIMIELAQNKELNYTIVYYATQLADFKTLRAELNSLWPD